MEIRDMRRKAGLTQKAMSELYHIPLQTLKQWESSPESSSYRKPPEYVVYMLERLLAQDFNVRFRPLDRAENLIVAAQHSRGDARQWMRYLRKEFTGQKFRLSDSQINAVLDSTELSPLQKIIFKRATTDGTATNAYIISLNSRAKTPMVDRILKRRHQDE